MALINCKECGKEISSEAATCPHCGIINNQVPKLKPKTKLHKFLIGFAVFIFVMFIIGQFNKPETTQPQAQAQAQAVQPVAQQDSKPIEYNDFQLKFMTLISNYAKLYKQAENELQKSALVTDRQSQYKTLPGTPREIKNWIGVLEKIGTNGDGHAYITVSLSPDLLTVSTWNNSFSDAGDNSLIKQTSPMYAKLAQMKEGNVIKFSGRLKHPKNMTEDGKMTEPDYLFIFSNVEKIAESAAP